MNESKQNQAFSGNICIHNTIPQPFKHETKIFTDRNFLEFSCTRALILTEHRKVFPSLYIKYTEI